MGEQSLVSLPSHGLRQHGLGEGEEASGETYLTARETHGHHAEVLRVGEKLGGDHRGVHTAGRSRVGRRDGKEGKRVEQERKETAGKKESGKER